MRDDQSSVRVFLVAGEESGDRLGAALMEALKLKTHGAIEFFGVGGVQMARAGLKSLFPLDKTAIIGFGQILPRLQLYLRRIRETAASAVAAKPDVLVIIDSPEFTHRVAKRVRKHAPEIPIVDYVCPSVWAWRPWRARSMRRYIDHVLALLPFEPTLLAKLRGPPATYVGHPLSERVGVLRPNREEEARRSVGSALVLLMPGSRPGELKRMLPLFEGIAEILSGRLDAGEFVMPAVEAYADQVSHSVARWQVPVRVISATDEKDAAFRQARLAVVKSGTGTLELALAGVPMVATYRVSAVEAFVARRMLTVPSVILANLVLGENVVPEFLQQDATAEKIAEAALRAFADGPERRRQVEAFKRLDEIMEIQHRVPSKCAADIVLDYATRTPAKV
jgi:lipid-A-disaccharide synthase